MNGNVTGWKNMLVEDKILFVMEVICFVLTAGTIGALIFVLKEGTFLGVILLIVSILAFIKCGLSARSSRDTFIMKFRLEPKLNTRKENKILKLN